MSTFRNTSGDDRYLTIDGVAHLAAAGDSFTIPDGYDYQLEAQPYFELLTEKEAEHDDPVVVPLQPPAPLVSPDADPVEEIVAHKPTVKDLKDALTARGIEFDPKAKKADLEAALADLLPTITDDGIVDPNPTDDESAQTEGDN